MANIEIERKSGMGAWVWILGLVLAALLIWGLVEMFDTDADVVATAPGDLATPATETGGMPVITDVGAMPASYLGQTVGSFEAQVTEVVGDRAFWIESGGQRMLVVLNEGGAGTGDVQGQKAERPDINSGNTVRISDATVRDASYMSSIAGPLDDQTSSLVQSQPAYLLVNDRNVQLMGG